MESGNEKEEKVAGRGDDLDGTPYILFDAAGETSDNGPARHLIRRARSLRRRSTLAVWMSQISLRGQAKGKHQRWTHQEDAVPEDLAANQKRSANYHHRHCA